MLYIANHDENPALRGQPRGICLFFVLKSKTSRSGWRHPHHCFAGMGRLSLGLTRSSVNRTRMHCTCPRHLGLWSSSKLRMNALLRWSGSARPSASNKRIACARRLAHAYPSASVHLSDHPISKYRRTSSAFPSAPALSRPSRGGVHGGHGVSSMLLQQYIAGLQQRLCGPQPSA